MFDYHLHSRLSFDSDCDPRDIVSAAEKAGLSEICFTDHYDMHDDPKKAGDIFTLDGYRANYEGVASDIVKIRHGLEFGLTLWNADVLSSLTASYDFDFVIGSVHYADGYDPYFEDYWKHNPGKAAFERYLLHTYECVKAHNDFDVLGHLNYICKSPHNIIGRPLYYRDFPDICDEIMRTLADNGKGMEINTSGIDRVGACLPDIDFFKRFRELGGEIVTVGSDSHDAVRVGQYIDRALFIASEVFGHVCSFEKRRAKFYRL